MLDERDVIVRYRKPHSKLNMLTEEAETEFAERLNGSSLDLYRKQAMAVSQPCQEDEHSAPSLGLASVQSIGFAHTLPSTN